MPVVLQELQEPHALESHAASSPSQAMENRGVSGSSTIVQDDLSSCFSLHGVAFVKQQKHSLLIPNSQMTGTHRSLTYVFMMKDT